VIDVGATVEGRFPHGELVQVGLHLRPGHSGGPLVDVQGRLVGISTMINGPDVGLAVPVHVVQAFLEKVLAARARAKTQIYI
jgi:S1-C subfamily serine protease